LLGVPLTLKALRPKDYFETPQTLGQHLKKRRRELGLLQREASDWMGILTETYANWEKDKTQPVAAQFRPVREFLGYDPTPAARTLAERVQARRRVLGVTFAEVAKYLGWDAGTLTRYLNGTWPIPLARAASLEAFLTAPAAELGAVWGFGKSDPAGAATLSFERADAATEHEQ
jgi:transcriptional regulator with XRE-family HTH domain